jgi:flavin-dependent dehydrogenase
MVKNHKYDVLIVGGGLAGLCCALHLAKAGENVLVIEKNTFPHHKVCGEYISNEVLPYLNSLNIDPLSKNAVAIDRFRITDVSGDEIETQLPLGGFGMSRYALDHLLYKEVSRFATVVCNTVTEVHFNSEEFRVQCVNGTNYCAQVVVGAFGKRSILDKTLKRKFMDERSPWLAVKAHYNYAFPENTVALHNFKGGYCGLSKTETGAVNACYLATYDSFQPYGDISLFQKEVLSANPHLADFFRAAKPLFKKPLTIGQISFQKKPAVKDHIFFIGDSAGLIHPLCGNGMAMAIHAAKLFSEIYLKEKTNGPLDRERLEKKYTQVWNAHFSGRLRTGNLIQKLLLQPVTAKIGFKAGQLMPGMVRNIIKRTHGAPL